MQSSMFLWLSQARTNWEGCGRKGIWNKIWGMMRVSVERQSEWAVIVKLVLGDRLVNVFSVYAPHSGKPDDKRKVFLEWCVDEAGMCATGWDGCVCWHDMSGRVDGSRILEFADRLNLHWSSAARCLWSRKQSVVIQSWCITCHSCFTCLSCMSRPFYIVWLVRWQVVVWWWWLVRWQELFAILLYFYTSFWHSVLR